ncbi:Cyclohexanone 1 [Lasiodiplodia hormozganensis]|uniref:Cyclohexanone 1 n=1 Tax=Lasiodiplodia hormozganensis TaxID=869390 RepID=A0AA39WT29_9PEZI|nr:Cyclohexanone 1 [Lasiodiplodia hormozganensis]
MRHYLFQPEVLACLNYIVDKHDLRKYMKFKTEMVSADYDESADIWRMSLKTGDDVRQITTRYLVTALRVLSKPHFPEITGSHTFKNSKVVHSQQWSPDIEIEGKQVGVIGLRLNQHPYHQPVDPSHRALGQCPLLHLRPVLQLHHRLREWRSQPSHYHAVPDPDHIVEDLRWRGNGPPLHVRASSPPAWTPSTATSSGRAIHGRGSGADHAASGPRSFRTCSL